MPFPFALSRMILLCECFESRYDRLLTVSPTVFIVISNAISSVLSMISFHEKTGGVFQVLAICVNILSLLTPVISLCYQFARRDEEAGNTRNLCLFGICGLLGIALAASLTAHAGQDGGRGICNNFANAGNPCVHAGVQLGMAYVTPLLALIGCIVSWIDKFPGAVKVTPRYPITKAPSSHFAAYAHALDENYTRPPAKASSRNNSGWSDVPLHY
ncbi:hypothetical protein L210DRAFT_849203 [Boletus edulis BED1]|uniref:Uncharacterized protein n=1 Tax=Boletus edulis BED1 TaxID=1328754 RepID=A0AAD4C4W6_BOLED|nr:hypothetical protein L210DRAFT_849203 [Boletus edulis BED1]